MKTFRLILALAAVALTAVSCVEKSGKYQTLLAQRDSLLTVEQKYDQTLEILNEIETGFQSIREVEDRVMTQISDIENKPLDKKQQTSAGRNDPESRTDRIASDRAVPKKH